MEVTTTQWIIFEVILLLICEFAPISPFLARKLCHVGSGIMMLQLDPSDYLARWFVYAVAISSLMMVWEVIPFQFRYSRSKDIGISMYLVIVVIFFYTQMPLHIIQPVFYADPMGAIVGKALTKLIPSFNPQWIGKKTVGGTLAVFITSIITLTYGTLYQKILIGAVSALVEAISLDYDNIMIAAVVIAGYKIFGIN